MKQADIDKALILIYRSSNHQMYINYTKCPERLAQLTPPERAELIDTLRFLAKDIEQEELNR